LSKTGTKKTKYSLVLPLFLIMTGLLVWGLFMIFSSSAYSGGTESADVYHFLKTQVIAEAAGLFVIVIFLTPIGDIIFAAIGSSKGRVLLLIVSAVSVVLLIKFGITRNGATRWYQLFGLNIQPAEICKIAVIIYLAGMTADYPALGRADKPKGYAILMLPPAVLAILVWKITDNLSSAIIIAGIAVLMVFVTIRDIKVHMAAVLAGAAGMVAYVSRVALMDYNADIDYRTKRIIVWLNPEEHLRDGGFQPLQALYAIGSGGIAGKGIGRSIQKLGTIPEVHNDMIFSVICEETGLIGAALLIIIFAAMIAVMSRIAAQSTNIYNKMVVTGVMFHIAIQVALNIMVVTAMMPNTGVGLPFISYGGSSALFLMTEMGMVFRVAKDNAQTDV